MTREKQILKAGIEYTIANKPKCIAGDNFKDLADIFNRNPAFEAGAQWADAHPVSCDSKAALYFNNIIYENGYKEAVDKAYEWLKEQSCCGYIEDTDVDEFIKQFKEAMKGD